MEKKLWCVSIKHEIDESENLFHVKAETAVQAKEIAVDRYIDNPVHKNDRAHFDQDIEDDTVVMYAIEVDEILE